MRAFFLAYSNTGVVPQAVGQLNAEAIVAQAVGQFEATPPGAILNLPWGHNCVLIEKLKEYSSRLKPVRIRLFNEDEQLHQMFFQVFTDVNYRPSESEMLS